MIDALVKPHTPTGVYGVVVTQAAGSEARNQECAEFAMSADEYWLAMGGTSVNDSYRSTMPLRILRDGMQHRDLVKRAAWIDFASEIFPSPRPVPLKAFYQDGFTPTNKAAGSSCIVTHGRVGYKGDTKVGATIEDIYQDLVRVSSSIKSVSFTADVYSGSLYAPNEHLMRFESVYGLVIPMYGTVSDGYPPIPFMVYTQNRAYPTNFINRMMDRITAKARNLSTHHDFAVISKELYGLAS